MGVTVWQLDYQELAHQFAGKDLDVSAFAEEVTGLWCADYGAFTAWDPQILEISLQSVNYLFDAALPSAGAPPDAEQRVVGVWGLVSQPAAARDRARQRGFVPTPRRWSGAGFDRGHFVAHSLGGGTDINFFPQARDVNRGVSEAGRRWRGLERHAAGGAGAWIFVRPLYEDHSWTPAEVELCVVHGASVRADYFDNRPAGAVDEALMG